MYSDISNLNLQFYTPAESSLRSSCWTFPASPQTGWYLKGKQTLKITQSFYFMQGILNVVRLLGSSYLYPSLFCKGEDAPASFLQAASPLQYIINKIIYYI